MDMYRYDAMNIPLHRLACVLHCTVQQHSHSSYPRVSTNTLFFIELLEALDSENMERLLKDRSKNNIQISIEGKPLK